MLHNFSLVQDVVHHSTKALMDRAIWMKTNREGGGWSVFDEQKHQHTQHNISAMTHHNNSQSCVCLSSLFKPILFQNIPSTHTIQRASCTVQMFQIHDLHQIHSAFMRCLKDFFWQSTAITVHYTLSNLHSTASTDSSPWPCTPELVTKTSSTVPQQNHNSFS